MRNSTPSAFASREDSLTFPLPRYRGSRTALGDTPEIQQVADALEASAARRPNAGIAVPGTVVRVLRARRYGEFPALRLYYCVGGAMVYLLWIEHWDEMEP